MARHARPWIAAALLAAVFACSSEDDPPPSGTCTPTAQSAPNPAGVEAYCAGFGAVLCDRGFSDCTTLGATEVFANVGECRTVVANACALQDFSNDWLDAPCADACLAYLREAPCGVFFGLEPQACAAATGTFPYPCTATISPGSPISDTITIDDPVFEGGHSKTYCIGFTSGQSVVIETSPPLAGTAIEDTVLHLIGPSGREIAFNDDAVGLYSKITTTVTVTGEHRIVVHGWQLSDLGSYQLTVTTP